MPEPPARCTTSIPSGRYYAAAGDPTVLQAEPFDIVKIVVVEIVGEVFFVKSKTGAILDVDVVVIWDLVVVGSVVLAWDETGEQVGSHLVASQKRGNFLPDYADLEVTGSLGPS